MRTLVRTFHIEEELDRKMVEKTFRSTPRLTKTQIVNDALRAYLNEGAVVESTSPAKQVVRKVRVGK